ncbi:hypothetical protein GCM10020256_09030 [Streptomyces thermocoprophilus]
MYGRVRYCTGALNMCTSRVYGTSAINAIPTTACTRYSTGTPSISPVSGRSVNRLRAHGPIVAR